MENWSWMVGVTTLLAVVGGLVFWWARSRRSDLADAADGAGSHAATEPELAAYSPKNVGNDASARPWEHVDNSTEPAFGVQEPPLAVPGAGFDVDAFLATSKQNFIRLQDAWDRADIPALRAMMTDEMTEQIRVQLAERESHTGDSVNQTEVVMLEAQLLGLEELPEGFLASVEFSGMIREDPAAGPNPFREVWNITRPKSGQAGWLVAGVQALQ
jgi:predicted lipid-binding transport protein (Tim44 family)